MPISKTARSHRPDVSRRRAKKPTTNEGRSSLAVFAVSGEDDKNGVNARSGLKSFLARLQEPNTESNKLEIMEALTAMSTAVDEDSISAILSGSIYFDQMGDHDLSSRLSQLGLQKALGTKSKNLQRRAHNVAAVVCAAAWDFNSAFTNFEKALILSLDQNQFSQFAVLCNIVSTLQIIGFLEYAGEVSLKLMAFPSDTPSMRSLHFQNAMNAAVISFQTGDFENLKKSNAIVQALSKELNISPLHSTFSRAVQAYYLLSISEYEEAYEITMKEMSIVMSSCNVRAKSAVLVLKAECAVLLDKKELIIDAFNCLSEVLPKVENYLSDQEDVLRALIKLKASATKHGLEIGTDENYVRKLSYLVIGIKQRIFFRTIEEKVGLPIQAGFTLEKSCYRLPPAIVNLPKIESEPVFDNRKLTFVDERASLSDGLGLPDPSYHELEAKLRSRTFEIAESWSVAAEYKSGDDGRRGFKVGKIAQLLAIKLGYTPEESIILEMACRLHNIGNVAFDESLHESIAANKLDPEVIKSHTLIGEALLEKTGDRVALVAATVARFHHAWWNGRGYPEGISGLEIPLNARICAVADSFLLLLDVYGRHLNRLNLVLRQLDAMSGVQLDPYLVNTIVGLLAEEDDGFISGIAEAAKENELDKVRPICGRLLKMINSL